VGDNDQQNFILWPKLNLVKAAAYTKPYKTILCLRIAFATYGA